MRYDVRILNSAKGIDVVWCADVDRKRALEAVENAILRKEANPDGFQGDILVSISPSEEDYVDPDGVHVENARSVATCDAAVRWIRRMVGS